MKPYIAHAVINWVENHAPLTRSNIPTIFEAVQKPPSPSQHSQETTSSIPSKHLSSWANNIEHPM